jgi:protein-disulfide isomerase
MTALQLLVILVSGLLFSASLWAQLAQAEESPETEEQIKEQIREFVARTITLVPLKDIQVAELDAPDSGGLRKVVVKVLSGDAPVAKTFYLTANNREILEGTLETLEADPWKEMRGKLEPMVEHAPSKGPVDSAVSLVEFSDFECPFCSRLNIAIEELQKQYPSQVRWIFLNYPLFAIHPWARAGAIAGVCVAEQSSSKFWMFEPVVYEHQQEIKPDTAPEQLRRFALEAGAAAGAYDACMQSQEAAKRVNASIAAGQALGVSGTPTLFINGRRVVGGVSLDALEAAVANELELGHRGAGSSGAQRQSGKE